MLYQSAIIALSIFAISCSSIKQATQSEAVVVPPAKPSITTDSLMGKWVSTQLTCKDGKTVDSKGRLSLEITSETVVFGVQESKKPKLDKYGPWMLQGEILTLVSDKQLSSLQIAKPSQDVLIAKMELKTIKGLCPKGETAIEFAKKSEVPTKK